VTAEEAIAALDLPSTARVGRRVPKALLLGRGTLTAADRRRISEGIEQIDWVAALKPTTVGVAAFRDEAREYLEIALLRVTMRDKAEAARILELLHRAIPYPVLALAELAGCLTLSVAHKRWSQGEAGRTVLDGDVVVVNAPSASEQHRKNFDEALALARQPRASLLALYQGWLDTLLALKAARLSGRFAILLSGESRALRREALEETIRLEAEISRLRTAAAREKQIARQVELNLALKRAEAARMAALGRL
jgi:hypothetical protein